MKSVHQVPLPLRSALSLAWLLLAGLSIHSLHVWVYELNYRPSSTPERLAVLVDALHPFLIVLVFVIWGAVGMGRAPSAPALHRRTTGLEFAASAVHLLLSIAIFSVAARSAEETRLAAGEPMLLVFFATVTALTVASRRIIAWDERLALPDFWNYALFLPLALSLPLLFLLPILYYITYIGLQLAVSGPAPIQIILVLWIVPVGLSGLLFALSVTNWTILRGHWSHRLEPT